MPSNPRRALPGEGEAAQRFVLVRVPGTTSGITPQIEEARIAVLGDWLAHFLRDYADRFPASGTVLGRPIPPPPFPMDCWWEHPELAVLLALLKMGDCSGGRWCVVAG